MMMSVRIKIKKLLNKLLFVFVLLMILSFPFQYDFLKINVLSNLIEGITTNIAPYIFEDTSQYTLNFYSDSTGMYLGIVVVFVIALIISLLWFLWSQRKNRFDEDKKVWFPLLIICICYYLSLQLSMYGFSKVFKYQFYDAHPNTAYTPVGFLTKDFLYWTSIGSSKLYNTVTGSLEVIIAVLLWFRKTRALASILGLMISLYLVLINFAFDINVKIQGLFFVFLFLIVSYSTLQKLFVFFFKGRSVQLRKSQLKHSQKYRPLSITIKAVLISLILIESLYPYVSTGNFNGDALEKPPYYGAYEITGHERYKRFFIHSDPYFIIQDHNDKLYSFPMDFKSNEVVLQYKESISILTLQVNDSTLSLDGDFFGYPLDIEGRKLNLSNMPIYEDSFQWTIDGYKKD